MLVGRQTELMWAHSLKQKGGRGAVLNSGLREASERLSFPPELPNIRQKPRTRVCRPWDLIFQVQKSRASDIWIKEVKGKLRPAGQCGPCLSGRKSPYPSTTKLDRPPWKARRGSADIQILPPWDHQDERTTAKGSNTPFLLIKQQAVTLAEQSYSINPKEASTSPFSRLNEKERHWELSSIPLPRLFRDADLFITTGQLLIRLMFVSQQ